MAKGRILIILLAKYLGDAGYQVHVAAEARSGFDMVRTLQPDCILCDVSLPDIDGFWVARRVRTEPSPVATAPFLFLTNAEDTESRLQGLNVGADIYLTRPFHDEEVVAQVGALIEMANRLRNQRQSFTSESPSSSPGAAFTGDIAQMSVATALTLLELERRSGYLKVRSGSGKVALLEIQHGALAAATLDDLPADPTPVLRENAALEAGQLHVSAAQSYRHRAGPIRRSAGY